MTTEPKQTTIVDRDPADDAEEQTESRYGRISEVDDLDRYYSPAWPLDLLYEDTAGWLPWGGATVAEPCAGQGAMVDWLERQGHDVLPGDIDPGAPYPAVDATDPEQVTDAYGSADIVVTNPPYSCPTASAYDVLDAVLELGVPVAMLLRLSFLEPPKNGNRKGCYMDGAGDHRPHRVLILPRVQYGGPKGGDDNPATSCWVIWQPGRTRVGGCEARWMTVEDREALEGQTRLV